MEEKSNSRLFFFPSLPRISLGMNKRVIFRSNLQRTPRTNKNTLGEWGEGKFENCSLRTSEKLGLQDLKTLGPFNRTGE